MNVLCERGISKKGADSHMDAQRSNTYYDESPVHIDNGAVSVAVLFRRRCRGEKLDTAELLVTLAVIQYRHLATGWTKQVWDLPLCPLTTRRANEVLKQ
ncbi:hypothetical protein RR46_02812 [Papilio xuthus]|uniref:Uncharacterized protein n=1 Tax=Papilio xuthus TaxID=66420 RepID=A0A194QD31_PAPXU|nr:hypothetical protein RR46_02812 [Papilio xuthus]